MKQVLYNVRFNLRDKNSIKATNIYCCIYINGKQHRFATGVKILPKQWDNKRQIAIISNIQSKVDNYNNNIVNQKLNDMRESFSNYLEYICGFNDTNITYYSLKTFMYKMPNITPKELIEKAYNYSYEGKNTYNSYKSRLNAFIKYLDTQKINSLDVFKQSGFNAYKKYLLDTGTSKGTTNQHCQLIARLINDVIIVEEPFLQYGITNSVRYVKEKDVRPNKGRFPLTVDEVNLLENLVIDDNERFSLVDVAPKSKNGTVNNKYRSYRSGKILKQQRDIFVLQCRCGQRVGDLKQFLTGQYEIMEEDNITYFKISTQKSQKKIDSFILKDSYVDSFLEKYKAGFDVDIDKLGSDNSYYNLAIRKICKLVKIDRIINYRNSQDIECNDIAYEIITNHDGRHTFITNKILEGVSPDKLCYLTGHTDDTMIREIYTHLTAQNKIKILNEELGLNTEKKEKKENEIDIIFAYNKLKELEKLRNKDIMILDLPALKDIVSIIKDTTKLDIIKDIDEQFTSKVKEIAPILWYIGKNTADTELYRIYQYKCKVLGVSNTIFDDEVLSDIWQQELADEERAYYNKKRV